MSIFTLEEYCCQSKTKLISTSGLVAEVSSNKMDVLIRSAPHYLQKGLITEETKNILLDPRFHRLYHSKVPDLKVMLANNNVVSPKTGKPFIASLCYSLGLDIINSPLNDKKNTLSLSLSSSEGSNDDPSMMENDPTSHFYRNNGKIYLSTSGSHFEINNNMLLELFKLLMPVPLSVST
jgi:hypothetical protein